MALLHSTKDATGDDRDKDKRAGDKPGTSRFTGRSSSTSSLIRAALDTPMASFYLVLVSASLLIALGVMMVLSASSVYAYMNYGGDSYYFVKRQLAFMVVGLVAALVLAKSGTKQLRTYAWIGIGLAWFLLILTYTPLGVTVNGNRNWVQLGSSFLRIQPSEFAKLALVMWAADVLTRKKRLLDRPKELLVPFLPVAGITTLLVIFQGDMGTAVILAGIIAGILFIIGTPVRLLAAMAGLAASGVAVMTISSPNRMRRFLAFLNPAEDTGGVNMQATVGVYALATGGWWGVGLGASRQKWGSLPAAESDYIFAVIGEELGLVGSLVVLALFLTLGYAGFRIAIRSDNMFSRVCAAGITTWFMFQSLVNLAVVLRLLPVMGVPLPMVSYGGSALLANMMALGVLIACARNEPDARAFLRKRKRAPKPKMTAVVGSRGRE